MMNVVIALPTFAVALSWLVFLVWYTIRAKWWKNDIGRNTFSVSLVIVAIFTRQSLIHIQESPPSQGLVWNISGALFLIWLSYLGIRRTYLMEKSQQERARMRALGYNRRASDI